MSASKPDKSVRRPGSFDRSRPIADPAGGIAFHGDLPCAKEVRMRLSSVLVSMCGVVALQGCAAALAVGARPSQAVLSEVSAMCKRDAGLLRFGPTPHEVEIWIPGEMTREPAPGQSLEGVKPLAYWSNTNEIWLRTGIASAFYANIDPSSSWPPTYVGPKTGAPAGVYKFELAPENDPRCVAYRKVADEEFAGIPRNLRRDLQGDQRCVVFRYLGPFDGRSHPNTLIRFNDASTEERGITRLGGVLLIDGKVRAKFVSYSVLKPGVSSEYSWRVGACEKPGYDLVPVLAPEN